MTRVNGLSAGIVESVYCAGPEVIKMGRGQSPAVASGRKELRALEICSRDLCIRVLGASRRGRGTDQWSPRIEWVLYEYKRPFKLGQQAAVELFRERFLLVCFFLVIVFPRRSCRGFDLQVVTK